VVTAASWTELQPAPEVELINCFELPHDNAVATARTCYSSKVVYPQEVSASEKSRALRDKIARSIYQAGHHTTIQHPTFQFVLKRVSRQFLWSFLHSHPFYNSEQVSQRYVKVKPSNRTRPPLPNAQAAALFDAVCDELAEAYGQLTKALLPSITELYYGTFPARRKSPKRWRSAIKKRAYELARYLLPVATHAHLYHTISGLTLHRYHRLADLFDAPAEQRAVVDAMVAAVRARDPMFFENLEDPLPLEASAEHELMERFHDSREETTEAFIDEFDADLEGRYAKLVDWKQRGEETVAQAVRSMLGLPRAALSDDEAIALALDPARNSSLTGALNVTSHAKLTRALHHAHFSFRKVLSHSADSQDQRHRMVPGSRPILAAQLRPGVPDVILPPIIAAAPEALKIFNRAIASAYRGIERLIELGTSRESALYLLPNAAKIRFEESGDLLNLRHKWALRLCYLAQEEIFCATRDEVLQVREVAPRIGALLGPPCWSRHRLGLKPHCPEGERFCGVRVWELDLADYDRW